MYSLTQGTIITGVRSDKYSNIRCNGVVISARCDLANCKISKIYYLIAVPSDDWLLSDEGFNIVLSQRQNDLEDKLQTKLGGSGLDWSTLKSFSVEEFSTVIHDQEVGLKKDTDKVLEVFRTFKNYTSKYLELGDKKAILQNESKSVASSLLKIANGQMMHYIYVPENAYIKDGSIDRGLSGELCKVFDTQVTPKGVMISMLQHEFSIQIKGRTDCTIEEYYQIPRISNALPVETQKDKEFVFSIFLEYQNMLRISSVYDIDDITVQALAQWNAPIWRRERRDSGFDYIFVDEMHLFNINEQHVFHYLTKSAEQKQIPICFALDYGQAIGDRGNTNRDYIETAFGEVERNDYKTVFRCSQQITDFCAAISASGALMFQNDYRDPYDIAASGFTQQEEAVCDIPRLYMYSNEEEMIESLKGHVDRFKQETQCKNYDIALISFEDTLLIPQNVEKLSSLLGKKMYVLKNRQTSSLSRSIKTDDPIILSDPYNVNGLEFKCVILFGVDEGRLPQNTGVSDISANYIKYIAFNQLYLASSRAKYRLILIGNSLHGVSSCLQYALESGKLETGDQV